MGAAFGAAGLEGLKNNVSNSMALLQGNLASFTDLPCLRPNAQDHMHGFQADTAGMSRYFNGTHKEFMTRAQKPIEGNGKCEGGFNAVAKGAADRAWDSYEWGMGVYGLQTRFSQSFDDHVNSQPLHVADTPESGDCEYSSIEMYKGIQQNGNLVNSSLNAYRNGVKAVQDGFVKYHAANSRLESNCGSLDKQMISFADIEKGISLVEVPQGKSFNPSSTITGKIKNDDLSTFPEGPAAPTLEKPNYSSAEYLNGISSITSSGAKTEGPSLSRTELASQNLAEKDAILKSGVSTLAIAASDNLAKSEEMAVRLVLSGKSVDGRSPASSKEGGALETLVSAQQQQLSAEAAAAAEASGAANGKPGPIGGIEDSGEPAFIAPGGAIPIGGYSSMQSKRNQGAQAQLGSPDESLFRRMSVTLRQSKRELEKLKR